MGKQEPERAAIPSSIRAVAGFKYQIATLLVAAALIAWGLGFAHLKAQRMVNLYVPIVHAAMEARIQTTLAHLWFEEILAKDTNESINDVRRHLDQADWYLNAMLHGGGNEQGQHLPLEDPMIRADIETVQAELVAFREIMEQRYVHREVAMPGTPLDQEFDRIFERLMAEIDDTESRLRQLIAEEQLSFQRVQFSVMAGTALVLAFLGFSLMRYHRIQSHSLLELGGLNARLTEEVSRRAKAEANLKAAHDGLEERVKARTRQLHDSEERFRALVETSSDWIWETDRDGVYTYVSPKVKDILGYLPEQIVGHKPYDFMTEQSADEVARAFEVIAERLEPFRDLINVNIHSAGHEVILETSGVPYLDDDGKLAGWRGIDRDITHRKHAETRLRTLSQAVEQSADMVFITDEDGNIEYVNESFERLTGYTAEEAIGENPRFLGAGDTPKEIYKQLWDTIKEGETWRHEIKDRRKNGKTFWSSVTITPIKDENDRITHFVSTHKDITERKRAEEATLTALRQTDIANKAKSDLIANMSHELRTPLNAILGFSETIREGIFGPLNNDQYSEYVGLIHASGAHLLDIINDILDVSALEAGRMELNENPSVVEDIIHTCMRLVSHRAEDGGIYLKSDLQPDVPPLWIDERRVKQIILNLLTNAVKFTEPGGTVTVHYGLNKKGQPELVVADTGVGMTEEELAKAMTQFGQVDSGLDRKHEGTGLGLPLAKGLARMHDAKFDVHSAKGKGTTITITFPGARVIKNLDDFEND